MAQDSPGKRADRTLPRARRPSLTFTGEESVHRAMPPGRPYLLPGRFVPLPPELEAEAIEALAELLVPVLRRHRDDLAEPELRAA